jgi:hypothetical protein
LQQQETAGRDAVLSHSAQKPHASSFQCMWNYGERAGLRVSGGKEADMLTLAASTTLTGHHAVRWPCGGERNDLLLSVLHLRGARVATEMSSPV